MGKYIEGIIRHLLTTGGGALATEGLLSQDEVTAGIGAIITLGGIIWSIFEKKVRL